MHYCIRRLAGWCDLFPLWLVPRTINDFTGFTPNWPWNNQEENCPTPTPRAVLPCTIIHNKYIWVYDCPQNIDISFFTKHSILSLASYLPPVRRHPSRRWNDSKITSIKPLVFHSAFIKIVAHEARNARKAGPIGYAYRKCQGRKPEEDWGMESSLHCHTAVRVS